MSNSEPTPDPNVAMTPEDLLPPVKPPSAAFILQLFVVPGVIVLAIVMVWLLFSWIAHSTSTRPQDVIQGLEGSGPARWQRASELADLLRSDRYAEFRRDPAAAAQLASILDREIDAAGSSGGMSSDAIHLRYFLCRALGEFQTDAGVEVLLKAAMVDRDPAELLVRRGAIQAIAVSAYHQLHGGDPGGSLHPHVEPMLLRLAEDENQLIRSETAYALGRLATPNSIDKLKIMVDDPHADTRYNAAVALAERGYVEAIESLAEMLDLTEMASVREEADPSTQVVKRAIIIRNALRAVVQLAEQQPDADFSLVIDSLKNVTNASPSELREARVDSFVAAEVERTLEFLQQRDAS